MLMNVNTIKFKNFLITIPKLDDKQYMLLRYLLSSIQKKQVENDVFFMSISLFPNIKQIELKELLKQNIEITVINKETDTWSNFYVINDIEIKKDRIYFTPARIIKEIVHASEKSTKKSFLRYMLFNGIRLKHTLLLIDFILNQETSYFEISVTDLKKVFELEDWQYINYYAFKVKVIDRAVKEINEKTSLYVEYRISKKEWKKVVNLMFTFYDRGSYE